MVLKKDINFIFFVLVIIVVIGFVAFTVYYQSSFRNINQEYNRKISELNQVTNDLLAKKSVLSETTLELNKTQEGREELGKKYNDLKSEKDKIENEMNLLKFSLEQTRDALANKTTELKIVSAKLIVEQKKVVEWEGKYKSCNQKLNECKEDLEECQQV